MSRRRPGHRFTLATTPLSGRAEAAATLRALPSTLGFLLRRPATLLLAGALLVGIVIGSVGTANERAAYGRIEPLATNDSPALAAAAADLEARLNDGGIAYQALYRPFVGGAPTDDAGLGVYSIGFLEAERGYLQTEVVSRSTLATLESPGERSLFRRQVVRIVDEVARYRWSRTVDPGVPGRTEDGMGPFADIATAIGNGADLDSVRLLPTLLRELEITTEAPTNDGGRDLLGRAAIWTYPGAVVANGAAMSDPIVIVALHLDAANRLETIALRAVNLNMPGVEYVTELRLVTPPAMPSWAREELR